MQNDSTFRRNEAASDFHYQGAIQAIIVDWAGTIVDFGSRAPAKVFVEIFRRRGIQISEAQARFPMGMSKRDHILTIAQMPEVDSQWKTKYDRTADASDVDEMYAEFLPLQLETLKHHGDVIPGAIKIFQKCRERDIKIGSSTGYTKALMDVVTAAAEAQGLKTDTFVCADDVPAGRPAPWLCFMAAERLNVFPQCSIVKIDDTTVGIEAGRNAGCWTIGVTTSGNMMGLSEQELRELPAAEKKDRLRQVEKAFFDVGAHYVIESIASLMPVIDDIDRRLKIGQQP